ncbi:MAG: hypothetical protein E4H36_06025 [Spirochaetales bacterium]|nr:MAG: hypothetical protein E4H36_06025 [Spirochaetales bacterium]
MNKMLAVLFMVFAAAACLPAETVMVSIQTEGDVPLAENKALLPEAFAIEDGIMNEFFDEGHIVFNAGILAPAPPEPPFKAESAGMRLAKSGGASLLLEIIIRWASGPSDDQLTVESVYFRFIQVLSGNILADGALAADTISPEFKSAQEIGFEMGKNLARLALSVL